MCRLKLAGARGTVGVCGLKVPSLILPGHGFADPQHDFTELKLNFTEPGNGFTELKHNFTEPQHDFTDLHTILPSQNIILPSWGTILSSPSIILPSQRHTQDIPTEYSPDG